MKDTAQPETHAPPADRPRSAGAAPTLQSGAPPRFRVHFGGPDRPPGALRDLLEQRVDAVPPGGAIDWVTYYFRDRALAEALARARRRGVSVHVALDAAPHLEGANEAVRRLLSSPEALGPGLRSVEHPRVRRGSLRARRAHLHAKLYVFSHPWPVALVGSFNPSGDPEPDPEVIREIGDQDRGHNLLVEIADPALAAGLRDHARRLFHARHGRLEWLSPQANRVLRSVDTEVLFHPRVRGLRWLRVLRADPPAERVRVAVSHLNERRTLRELARLARRGARVEVIAHHDAERRIPAAAARRLIASGVRLRRYRHPRQLPMHDKLMLVETPRRRLALFGSLNLTARSRWLNHEIAVVSEDESLFRALATRWEEIAAEPWLQAPEG